MNPDPRSISLHRKRYDTQRKIWRSTSAAATRRYVEQRTHAASPGDHASSSIHTTTKIFFVYVRNIFTRIRMFTKRHSSCGEKPLGVIVVRQFSYTKYLVVKIKKPSAINILSYECEGQQFWPPRSLTNNNTIWPLLLNIFTKNIIGIIRYHHIMEIVDVRGVTYIYIHDIYAIMYSPCVLRSNVNYYSAHRIYYNNSANFSQEPYINQ